MKALVVQILFLFFISPAGAEEITKIFEREVLKEINSENIVKITLGTKVFQETDFFRINGVVLLDKNIQTNFRTKLDSIEWHDSMSIASRADAEFILIIETKSGSTYGLHASSGLESDCFQLVQVVMDKVPYVSRLYFNQHVKLEKNRLQSFNRVLRIPEWRKSEIGINFLSLVK
jgi:hypothetical protein